MKRILHIGVFIVLAAGGMSANGQSTSETVPKVQTAEKKLKSIRAEPIEAEPRLTVKQLENRIDKNMVTMTGLVEAMSNNLGQLHYLRALCFGEDDQKWRMTASEMMQIEAPNNANYRRQLIRAFNAGYYAQKARYTKCTSSVAMDVAALSENGRHLATMLGDPYRER